MTSRSEKLEFTGHDGRSTLAGLLERPDGPTRGAALFAHCFTCSKDSHAATRISAALAAKGFAVLRFDFTGLGASEGEFASTNFSSNVDDLVLAAEHMAERGLAPDVLIGHSLGGAAVLAGAHRIPSAEAVATIGAPADPAHVAHLFGPHRDEIEKEGRAELNLGGRAFTIEKQFLDDIETQRQAEAVANLNKALLVFHAPRDEIVGIENAAGIFQAAKHPKSFVSLDDADHLLSRRADSTYVADVLAAWAGRYIERDETERTEPGGKGAFAPDGFSVTVAERVAGGLAQDIVAQGHSLPADEPETRGGTETGPTPHGLLLAALGACTSMTLRMYARHKKMEPGRISVALRHEKVDAADVEGARTKEGKIDRIERIIRIDGGVTDEERARMIEIADKCPIHKTLTGEIVIDTKSAD